MKEVDGAKTFLHAEISRLADGAAAPYDVAWTQFGDGWDVEGHSAVFVDAREPEREYGGGHDGACGRWGHFELDPDLRCEARRGVKVVKPKEATRYIKFFIQASES